MKKNRIISALLATAMTLTGLPLAMASSVSAEAVTLTSAAPEYNAYYSHTARTGSGSTIYINGVNENGFIAGEEYTLEMKWRHQNNNRKDSSGKALSVVPRIELYINNGTAFKKLTDTYTCRGKWSGFQTDESQDPIKWPWTNVSFNPSLTTLDDAGKGEIPSDWETMTLTFKVQNSAVPGYGGYVVNTTGDDKEFRINLLVIGAEYYNKKAANGQSDFMGDIEIDDVTFYNTADSAKTNLISGSKGKTLVFDDGVMPRGILVSSGNGGMGGKLAPGVELVPMEAAPLADVLSIKKNTSVNNLLPGGSFDSEDCLDNWVSNAAHQTFEWIKDANGGYLRAGGISEGSGHQGFTYSFPEMAPGKYKITGYFRTAHEGHVSQLRLHVDGVPYYINITDEWLKVEIYANIGAIREIKIGGGPYSENIHPYCIDEIVFEKVDTIPSNPPTRFGKEVTPTEMRSSAPELYQPKAMWSAAEDAKYKVNGLMINQDEGFLYGLDEGVTKDELVEFVNQFEQTQLTDYIMCIGAHVAVYPSEVWQSKSDKYNQKVENGVAVDYKNEQTLKSNYDQFITKKVDYFEVFSEEFPKIGVNFWLSLRMNDHHAIALETSPIISDFYHENTGLRRNRYPTKVYVGRLEAYDYTYKEVRDHFLEIINESLSRYDVYGFELEFLREAWLWYYGGEYNGLDILNDFIADVDEIIKIYEKKYGHDIKLAVEVPSDIESCYYYGMDVVNWAANGYIDMVVPKAHHATDTTMPIREWSSLLKPYGVEIAPDIEEYIKPTAISTGKDRHTIETLAGTAALYYSQGADKIHLYNYYPVASFRFAEGDKIADYLYTNTHNAKGRWLMYTVLGSYEKCMDVPRKVLLTYNDMLSREGITNGQLGKQIMPGNSATFKMPVGDIDKNSKVTLTFSSTSADKANPPTLTVNGQICKFINVSKDSEGRTKNKTISYEVPSSVFNDGYFVVEVKAPREYIVGVDYMDVYIEPQK